MTNADRVLAWTEFVGLVRRRTGMYTISRGLLEVAALFIGFDNGIGPGVLREFQEWMSARHDGHGEYVFSVLVVHELTDDHETRVDLQALPAEVSVAAAILLLDLLDEFLQLRPLPSTPARRPPSA